MPTSVQPGHMAVQRRFRVAIGIAITTLALASALLLAIPLTFHSGTPSKDQPHTAPIPTHPSPGIPSHPLPGFGFDLGTSYVAASIRHPNGTFDDFVFDNASDVYQQFLRESSIGRERCRGDWPELQPERTSSEILPHEDPGRHPAVDILQNIIGKTRDGIQYTTGLRIDKAVVSNPKFPALCEEDINAALRGAGVEVVRNSRILRQPHELSASYAAYGRGLCSDYTRRNPCEYEERWEQPPRVVMAVTYTDEALLVEYSKLTWAVSNIFQQNSLIDWEAGASALSKTPHPQLHWDRIRTRLLEKAVSWRSQWPRADIVILAGPHARNETFLEVVKDTFANFQDDPPELLMDFEANTGARGAAELAFRSQYQH